MTILNFKYIFAIVALLTFSSLVVYNIIGKTDCFWNIFYSLGIGSLVISIASFLFLYIGNKIFLNSSFKKTNKKINY
jgi:hypothetical protein